MSDPYPELTGTQTRLVELGFAATLDEIGRMRELHSADAIERSLKAAADNAGARQFLSNLIGRIRADAAKVDVMPRQEPLPLNSTDRFGKRKLSYNQRHPQFDSAHLPVLNTRQQVHVSNRQSSIMLTQNENGLVIRGAPVQRDGKLNWDRQVALTLTHEEILRALAVLLNRLQKAWGQGTIRQTGRWFQVVHDGKILILRVAGSGVIHRVEITTGDAFKLSALLLAQIRRQVPAGAESDVESLVRLVVAPMAAATLD